MAYPYFSEQTLDDVMRRLIDAILASGDRIKPSKGWCTELLGVVLEIANPRARLSRTETRGKLFSALGELCWYLSGTNEKDFISYYISDYINFAEGDILFGGYGPRLFDWKMLNQIENVTTLLKRKPESRQAVIQLFDAEDIVVDHKDIPCTCVLQFMNRRGALHMITYMRSNDVFRGLPHDIFSFTMLQEIMARQLGIELGPYKHVVGSIHLYDLNKAAAQEFLDEGWQSTEIPMPSMPPGDPWPSIRTLLEAEKSIRVDNNFNIAELKELDSYWTDLIRLLQIYKYSKTNDSEMIESISRNITTSSYQPFVNKKLSETRQRTAQRNNQ